MAYSIETKDGIVIDNIPDNIARDGPELRARVAQARQQKAQAQTFADASGVAMENTPYEAVMANIGAGMTDLGMGVRQLASKVGIGSGPTDEEIQDKRIRDKALAQNTFGGTLLQILGQAAPTLAIPVGPAVSGGARLLGMAAPRLSPLANAIAARGLANTAAQGALGGAMGGGLQATKSDESRLANIGLGMLGGATLGTGLGLAGMGLGRLTRAGGANAAARELQGAATDLPAAQADLAAYNAQPQRIPLSGAAAAGDEGLARAENAARTRNGADFYQGDQARAAAVAQAVQDATAEATQLAARRGARQAGWQSDWANVANNVDPAIFEQRMAQFLPAVQVAQRAPEASNPAVRGVLQAIQDEIERVGPENFTPAHLQQLRANLNARGKAIPQNAWQAAPRDSAAVNSIMQEMDNILNSSSGNAWDDVLRNYAANSRLVDQSKAAGRVRDAFYDDTGRVRGTAADPAGDIPNITQAGLGRAMDAARQQGATVASPTQQAMLGDTLEALRRQAILQSVKRSATAGGGSNTPSDIAASGLLQTVPSNGLTGMVMDLAKAVATNRKDRALADMLRDPVALQAALSRTTTAPGELSPAQQATLNTLARALGAGGADMNQRPN